VLRIFCFSQFSKSDALRILKRLNELGVIRTHKQSPKLISKHGSGIEFYAEDMLGYRFSIGSRLYEQFGNTHEFLKYPIQIMEEDF